MPASTRSTSPQSQSRQWPSSEHACAPSQRPGPRQARVSPCVQDICDAVDPTASASLGSEQFETSTESIRIRIDGAPPECTEAPPPESMWRLYHFSGKRAMFGKPFTSLYDPSFPPRSLTESPGRPDGCAERRAPDDWVSDATSTTGSHVADNSLDFNALCSPAVGSNCGAGGPSPPPLPD